VYKSLLKPVTLEEMDAVIRRLEASYARVGKVFLLPTDSKS